MTTQLTLDQAACPCGGVPPCWVCRPICNCNQGWGYDKAHGPDPAKCPRHGDAPPIATCPDHPSIARADCACPYEEDA